MCRAVHIVPVLLAVGAVGVVVGRGCSRPFPPAVGRLPDLFVPEVPANPDLSGMTVAYRLRREVAAEVMAGRVSLPEAAEAFRRLNGDANARILAPLPGRSQEEKLCRQVIFYVAAIEAEVPTREETAARLSEELDCRLTTGEFPAPEDETAWSDRLWKNAPEAPAAGTRFGCHRSE